VEGRGGRVVRGAMYRKSAGLKGEDRVWGLHAVERRASDSRRWGRRTESKRGKWTDRKRLGNDHWGNRKGHKRGRGSEKESGLGGGGLVG